MDKETKANEYVGILESLQRIRNGIVQENTDTLAMTGVMPERAQKELGVLLDITASVFVGFSELGLELTNKDSFVAVSIAGKEFLCPKAKLGVKQHVLREEVLSSAPESGKYTEEQVENKEPESVEVEEETEDVPNYSKEADSASEEASSDDDLPEYVPEEATEQREETKSERSKESEVEEKAEVIPDEDEEPTSEEDDEIESYVPSDESDEDVDPYVQEKDKEGVEDDLEEDTEGDIEDNLEDDNTSNLLEMINTPTYSAPVEEEKEETYEDTIEVKEEPVSSSAKVIGGEPVVSVANKMDFFVEEQSKKASEFVYMYSKIAVKHVDKMGGGRPEEMLVMIAPLEISKYERSSVPIVVTIVHRGKQKTCSSYDTLESGKNIVQIDIDEFYFLCRGAFDSEGRFKAMIVTTGPSAQQGDTLTILSSKTYGNSSERETRNGHVKFRYDAEAGGGVIEVIPFGHPGDDDFVALVRNNEFIDYYLISKSLKTQSKAVVFSKGGISNELICHWDDDVLEVELM